MEPVKREGRLKVQTVDEFKLFPSNYGEGAATGYKNRINT